MLCFCYDLLFFAIFLHAGLSRVVPAPGQDRQSKRANKESSRSLGSCLLASVGLLTLIRPFKGVNRPFKGVNRGVKGVRGLNF